MVGMDEIAALAKNVIAAAALAQGVSTVCSIIPHPSLGHGAACSTTMASFPG